MALGERNSKYTDSFSRIAHAPSLEALMAHLMEPDFLLPCAIFRMEDGIEDLLDALKAIVTHIIWLIFLLSISDRVLSPTTSRPGYFLLLN